MAIAVCAERNAMQCIRSLDEGVVDHSKQAPRAYSTMPAEVTDYGHTITTGMRCGIDRLIDLLRIDAMTGGFTMGKRTWPAAVLLIGTLLLLISAASAEPVDLTLKFTPGETVEYDISMSGSGSLRGPDGTNAAMGLRGSCRVSATVTEVLPDGNAKLQLLLPQAEMSATVAEQQTKTGSAP